MNNGQVKVALDCMTALCGPNNRLPVVAALKADRTLRALNAAWAPCEAVRVKLVEEHGTMNGNGAKSVIPGSDGWEPFVAAYNALASEKAEVAVEPIKIADVEQGYSRDPETGKKDSLDISPAQLGALVELGLIVTGPEA